MCLAFATSALDSCNAPESLIAFLCRAPQKKDTDFVSAPNRALRQFHRFRSVPFKVEPERKTARDGLELSFEVGAELGVLLLCLTNQIA
jgi:hypothetical protein